MSEKGRMTFRSGRFGITVNTKFHIDHTWWDSSGLDYRTYLYQQLCEECRQRFTSPVGTECVDWIDPETAEVRKVDALMECLKTTCTHHSDFIDDSLPLTAACFRVFLANQNMPLSSNELSEIFNQTTSVSPLRWPSEKILRVLNSRRGYLGLRPAV